MPNDAFENYAQRARAQEAMERHSLEQARINAINEAKAKLYRDEIQQKSKEVVIKAKTLSEFLSPKSDMQKLANDLSSYLQRKIDESDWGHKDIGWYGWYGWGEVEGRMKFIEKCVDAIFNGDVSELEAHLEEKNISPFKGFFSQKLYNTVKPFQFFSAKRQSEIIKGAPSLSSAIIKIIEEYDKGLHCNEARKLRDPSKY